MRLKVGRAASSRRAGAGVFREGFEDAAQELLLIGGLGAHGHQLPLAGRCTGAAFFRVVRRQAVTAAARSESADAPSAVPSDARGGKEADCPGARGGTNQSGDCRSRRITPTRTRLDLPLPDTPLTTVRARRLPAC